jgi:hypothetical protein
MIAAAAEKSDRIITLENYQTALGWLMEMEGQLTDIFKALGARGDGQVIEEAYHYLYRSYLASKEPINEHRLVGFLSERVPSYSVLRIIEVMERSGQIEKQLNSAGQLGWMPKTRSVH